MSLGANQYTLEDVILYSEIYKNESFGKSREAYVRALCTKLKLDIGTDIDFLVYLLNAAAEPDLHIINGKKLEKRMNHLFETIKEDVERRLNSATTFIEICANYKHYMQHISNGLLGGKVKWIDSAKGWSSGATSCFYNIGILVYDKNQNTHYNAHINPYRSHNNTNCCQHMDTFLKILMLSEYTTLASICIRSFKRYESLWNKKMLNHFTKNQYTSEYSLNFRLIDQKINILETQVEKQLADTDQKIIQLNIQAEKQLENNLSIEKRFTIINNHIGELKTTIDANYNKHTGVLDRHYDRINELEKQLAAEPKEQSTDPKLKQQIQSLQDTNKYLKEQLKIGQDAISAINVELAQLKLHTNQSEFVKSIQILPVYDYGLIKARRNLLHQEFRPMYRMFKRLIDLHYATPFAVVVSK